MAYGTRSPMPHSQGFSNNPYPVPNQPNSSLIPISLRSFLVLSPDLCRDLSKGLFLVGVTKKLTPWLMEPGGSIPHSQGLSNNSYPEPNQPNYPH